MDFFFPLQYLEIDSPTFFSSLFENTDDGHLKIIQNPHLLYELSLLWQVINLVQRQAEDSESVGKKSNSIPNE